ncbi:MAG: MBOAT family O-acyltransferase [Acutalibacteraceae bacterium]
MLFTSTDFLYLFLPVTVLVYYVFLRKSRMLQNIFLLFASLFFYGWGEPKFVLVMLMSIVANYIFALLVDRFKKKEKKALCRALIALTVVANLSILFIYKYLNFTAGIIESITGADFGIAKIALPIGISFFTFQAMSYVLDVYRDKGAVQKNIINVGLYISFFPQLIAGPIVRYETVAEEILHRKETLDDFLNGFARFIYGFAKKVLLSNNFAIVADMAFDSARDGNELSVAFAWLGAVAYTLQIFFDFGGYSDMAIGLGRMFGFHFLENFNYPYISRSITEFWRRWHMSLGTWFRDYVYFPLGGSRVNKPRLILNLFTVWFLTGVWHGANWTFIVWGLMYFVLLVIEKLTGFYKKDKTVLSKILLSIYTLFFVIMGWVVFRAESLPDAINYMQTMFGFGASSFADPLFLQCLKQLSVWLVIGILLSTPIVPFLKKKLPQNNLVLDILYCIFMVAVFIIATSSIVSSSYNPFIYFNF